MDLFAHEKQGVDYAEVCFECETRFAGGQPALILLGWGFCGECSEAEVDRLVETIYQTTASYGPFYKKPYRPFGKASFAELMVEAQGSLDQ